MVLKIKIISVLLVFFFQCKGQMFFDLHKIFDIDTSHVNQKYCSITKEKLGDSLNYYICYRDSKNNKRGSDILISREITQIGTWTKNIDTLIFDSSVCIFVNPFPHVYLHKKYSNSKGNGMRMITTGMYSFEQDTFGYKHSCMYNDSDGTLVNYWFNELLIKQGYFWDNKKNGLWKYWNQNGKLYRKEIWKKGVLKDTKEIP